MHLQLVMIVVGTWHLCARPDSFHTMCYESKELHIIRLPRADRHWGRVNYRSCVQRGVTDQVTLTTAASITV